MNIERVLVIKRKLAFSTLGCPSWSFEEIVSNAAGYGFGAIEIRGCQEEMQTEQLSFFKPENKEKTTKLLRENNIEICGVGTSCNFHTADLRLAAMTEGENAVNLCRRMQIPQIRVFGNSIPPERDENEVISEVAGGIAELCGYAAENCAFPIEILLEIHGDFNTVSVLSRLIEKLKDKKNFGIIFDVQHVILGEGKNWRELFDLVLPLVRHIHFKDYKMTDGKLTPCLMGEGEVPLSDIAAAFDSSGYEGYYSFEWEKRWHKTIEEPEIAFKNFVDFMQKL